MITPTSDPQPGEVWRYRAQDAVEIVEEVASPESSRRYLAILLTGPERGMSGIVYRDELREKTDEL